MRLLQESHWLSSARGVDKGAMAGPLAIKGSLLASIYKNTKAEEVITEGGSGKAKASACCALGQAGASPRQ